MQLHQLQSKFKNRGKKRIGRGGKRGSYSGKGQKGQKSRAGHRIRPAERDLIQRLPKMRGFKFKTVKLKPAIVNFAALSEKIKSGIINRQALLEAGLIRNSDKKVKILGPKKGKIEQPFRIEGLEISKKLKKEIEDAGGRIS